MRIFLVCGSGGVGKTTLSAALGLKFSREGYKTIVLTIDPAKRLADSLGIESLTDEPKKISLPFLSKGEMWAMMLDTKRTFDRIVEKYASSEETKHRIINNKLYQQMSQMLAGTQEYMAIERLYEIYKQNNYDMIIVDTPPMQNSIDFLNAPQRMMNMINNSMLHLLLKPSLTIGKSGLKLLERGSQQIIKVFDRITGFAFLQDLSEMIVAFKDLLGGFENRSSQIQTLLQHPDTQFMMVCTTQAHSLAETQNFYQHISSCGYHLHKIIVNRVYEGDISRESKSADDKQNLKKYFSDEESEQLLKNYQRFIPLIKRDKTCIKELSGIAGKESLTTIPLFFSDVHDVATLARVADFLKD